MYCYLIKFQKKHSFFKHQTTIKDYEKNMRFENLTQKKQKNHIILTN